MSACSNSPSEPDARSRGKADIVRDRRKLRPIGRTTCAWCIPSTTPEEDSSAIKVLRLPTQSRRRRSISGAITNAAPTSQTPLGASPRSLVGRNPQSRLCPAGSHRSDTWLHLAAGALPARRTRIAQRALSPARPPSRECFLKNARLSVHSSFAPDRRGSA